MTGCVNIKEKELARKIAHGDTSAKKYLYCQFAGYLTAVCSRYISEREDINDILQESFLKIFTSISSFEYRGEGSLKAWLTKIVVNESLKFLKKTCRFDMIPLCQESKEIADDETDIDRIPLSQLHSMIRELPVGYRTILNLFVFEEKSHKEIATELKITESTSASQFHRAKKLLAEKIKKYNSKMLSIAYEE